MGENISGRGKMTGTAAEIVIANYPILWLVPAFVVHELGHYITAWLFGARPYFEIKWWGVSVSSHYFYRMRLWEYAFVLFAGIILGFPFAAMSGSGEIILLYFLMSCIDISQLLNIIGNNPKWTLIRLIGNQYIKAREDMRKNKKSFSEMESWRKIK
jgi:hypothetical protein